MIFNRNILASNSIALYLSADLVHISRMSEDPQITKKEDDAAHRKFQELPDEKKDLLHLKEDMEKDPPAVEEEVQDAIEEHAPD